MALFTRKAATVACLTALPLAAILLREFVYHRRGWHDLDIQYQTVFWIVRVLLAFGVFVYTMKFWREASEVPALLLVQAAGFAGYSILHWSLSFGLSRMLLSDPDTRNWNLFQTIRSQTFVLNLLMYLLAVSVLYVWTYYERSRAAQDEARSFQESLRLRTDSATERQKPTTVPEPTLQTLNIKTGAKTVMVDIQQVLHFAADGPYVKVITGDRVHLLSQPLHKLEKVLPAHFLRVHRSNIVNTQFIQEVRSLLNGDYILVLKNGNEIRASRTYRERLRSVLGKL